MSCKHTKLWNLGAFRIFFPFSIQKTEATFTLVTASLIKSKPSLVCRNLGVNNCLSQVFSTWGVLKEGSMQKEQRVHSPETGITLNTWSTTYSRGCLQHTVIPVVRKEAWGLELRANLCGTISRKGWCRLKFCKKGRCKRRWTAP